MEAFPIRAVVLTTWEPSPESGWQPGEPAGELREWIEREGLTERADFAGGARALHMDAERQVLGVVTGVSATAAATAVMALGLDPRFDLSRAYWLLTGLAGVDPMQGTIGTPAWARHVVSDTQRTLDAREMPATWPHGMFSLGTREPGRIPTQPMVENHFALNGGLADWAFGQTRLLKLADTEGMQAARTAWSQSEWNETAAPPPRVVQGDVFASNAFWHGVSPTAAAREWVKLWTRGAGTFCMAAMEDAGVAEAIQRLARMGRVDRDRLMVLRTGSNFTRQAPGQTAIESIAAPFVPSAAHYNGWLTGSAVVRELVRGWARYGAETPAGA